MKKCVGFILSLVLALGCFTGCRPSGRQPEPKTSILIGVSVYDFYDAFIDVMMGRFQKYARELEQEHNVTVTIIHEGAGKNQITQNTQVESFIEAGCDIICVNLVDRTEASVIIDKAESAGIPIIFFNRELVEEDLERWDSLYYVGASAEESGIQQAQIVMDLLAQDYKAVDRNGDGKLQYVMLEGEPGHQDAIVRTEYSINTLIEAGHNMQRLGAGIANWSRAQAEAKMVAWLAQFEAEEQTIEIVFANNDEMALGAVAALKKSEIPVEEWPIVLGVDGTPDGIQAVRNGELAGTVLNDANGQACSMLDLAWALVFKTGMPETLTEGKYIRLPYQIIVSENVDDFDWLLE